MTKEYFLVTILTTKSGYKDYYSTYAIMKNPADHLIILLGTVTAESEIKFVLIHSSEITKEQYNTLRLK